MSKYREVIYPSDKKNPYPTRLIGYIYKRFMKGTKPKVGVIQIGGLSGTEKRKILDIGCCTGKALKLFKEFEDFDLYGVDIRDEEVGGIKFAECNIESEPIPFPDNTFDFVYSKSVLEHVVNTDNFVSEAKRVLKPGGVFIGLTPDWESQMSNFWDDYTHVKPFTRKGLRDCLRIHDFDNADCEYFYQLPVVWSYPIVEYVCRFVAWLLPDSWKWKDSEMRNTKDRKFIRFSKEKMLLSFGKKKEPQQ